VPFRPLDQTTAARPQTSNLVCRRQPTGQPPTWPRVIGALLLLLLAASMLGLRPPAVAVAQTNDTRDDTQGGSAWWARVNTVDDATACAAEATWVRASDVELQSEFDLTTDPLPAVLTGAELSRQTQVVAALEEQGHGVDRAGYHTWRTMGGSTDDVVLYVSYTDRVGDWDPSADRVSDNQWLETGQTAYRVVRQDGTWRVADRYVFDNTRRSIDVARYTAVAAAYQQLWPALVDAYDDRDLAGLGAVLVGQALDRYQQHIQALLDAGKVEHLLLSGHLGVIAVDDDAALVYFQGTLTTVEVAQATGQEQQPPPQEQQPQPQPQPQPPQEQAQPEQQQPVVLLERLVLDDGHWKIADDVLSAAQRAADGTVSIAGCGDPPD
jgi:hypothetical protein